MSRFTHLTKDTELSNPVNFLIIPVTDFNSEEGVSSLQHDRWTGQGLLYQPKFSYLLYMEKKNYCVRV